MTPAYACSGEPVRPSSLVILLALTRYPPLESDAPHSFGWGTADEVAHDLQQLGFAGLRAQHVATPLARLATYGDVPELRSVERKRLYGGPPEGPWAYRITTAGIAQLAERMLWARGSRGKGYPSRREPAALVRA